MVDIPVLGLGQCSMLYACTLGRRFGLITIDPIYIPWHEDQIIKAGLAQLDGAVELLSREDPPQQPGLLARALASRVRLLLAQDDGEETALADATPAGAADGAPLRRDDRACRRQAR